MKKNINRQLKRYFKSIRSFIPLNDTESRKFIRDLRSSVSDFSEDNENISFEDITKRFGMPQDIAFEYLESLDTDDLYRKLNIAGIIKIAAYLMIAAVIILSIYRIIMLYYGHVIDLRDIVMQPHTFSE
jgi:uncharacterized membrane protein